MKSLRARPLSYTAFLMHRISGLGLAIFLPLHFCARSGDPRGD